MAKACGMQAAVQFKCIQPLLVDVAWTLISSRELEGACGTRIIDISTAVLRSMTRI